MYRKTMDHIRDLSAFQDVLRSADKQHSFAALKFGKGNEEQIQYVVKKVFDFLKAKNYITIIRMVEENREEYKKLALYLVLNSDLPALEEMSALAGVGALVRTLPALPGPLLNALLRALHMRPFLYEIVAFCRPALALQLADACIADMQHDDPAWDSDHPALLAGALYRLTCRLHFVRAPPAGAPAAALAGLRACLAHLDTAPPDYSTFQHYAYLARNLPRTFHLIETCYDNFTSVQTFEDQHFADIYRATHDLDGLASEPLHFKICDSPDRAISENLSACNALLLDLCVTFMMNASVHVFSSWNNDTPQGVCKKYFRMNAMLRNIPDATDHRLVGMLEQISIQPREIKTIINVVHSDVIAAKICARDATSAAWLAALLDQPSLYPHPALLQALLPEAAMLDEEQSEQLFYKITSSLNDSTKDAALRRTVAIEAFRRCSDSTKDRILAEQFRVYFHNDLMTTGFEAALSETFDRLAAGKAGPGDALALFVQNPDRTLERLVRVAGDGAAQTKLMLRVAECLGKCCEQSYMGQLKPALVKAVKSALDDAAAGEDSERLDRLSGFTLELSRRGLLRMDLLFMKMPDAHTDGPGDIKEHENKSLEEFHLEELKAGSRKEQITASSSQPATADPSSGLFSQPATADPSSGLSSQPATADPSSGLSSQPATADPSSGLSRQPATADPSSGLSSQPATANPSSGLSRQPATANPSSGLSRQPATADPSSGLSSQPATADPSSGLSRQPATADPSSGLSRQPATADPSSGLSRQPATANPSSGLSRQPATANPSSGLSSQQAEAKPLTENFSQTGPPQDNSNERETSVVYKCAACGLCFHRHEVMYKHFTTCDPSMDMTTVHCMCGLKFDIDNYDYHCEIHCKSTELLVKTVSIDGDEDIDVRGMKEHEDLKESLVGHENQEPVNAAHKYHIKFVPVHDEHTTKGTDILVANVSVVFRCTCQLCFERPDFLFNHINDGSCGMTIIKMKCICGLRFDIDNFHYHSMLHHNYSILRVKNITIIVDKMIFVAEMMQKFAKKKEKKTAKTAKDAQMQTVDRNEPLFNPPAVEHASKVNGTIKNSSGPKIVSATINTIDSRIDVKNNHTKNYIITIVMAKESEKIVEPPNEVNFDNNKNNEITEILKSQTNAGETTADDIASSMTLATEEDYKANDNQEDPYIKPHEYTAPTKPENKAISGSDSADGEANEITQQIEQFNFNDNQESSEITDDSALNLTTPDNEDMENPEPEDLIQM